MERDRNRVNLRRLALMVLPTFLRKPLVGALLYSGLRPLERAYGELLQFRESMEYRVWHTGQVCKLRGLLNDAFDPEKRRIGISESPIDSTGKIIHRRREERWSIVSERGRGALQINRRGYGGINGYDFWVEVPISEGVRINESRLRAMVDNYKLVGKRYAINYK